MKKVIFTILFIMLMIGPAYAIPIFTLDPPETISVGSPDTYLGIASNVPPAGDKFELAAINEYSILDGKTFTLDNYTKFLNADGTNRTDLVSMGNGYSVFDFGTYQPEYFLLFQAGTGYVYKNINNLQYGVFAFDEISHISGVGFCNIPPTPVPEPGTLALMGMGLLGLGLVKRKF